MKIACLVTSTVVLGVLLPPPAIADGPHAHHAAVRCGRHRATIVGTSGDDKIEGTDGRDVIVGRGGDDTIIGNDGKDVICGGLGSDTIDGRYGADEVFGGLGNDRLVGGPRSDLLDGQVGADHLEGEDGGDSLVGGSGNDLLAEGSGNGWMFAGSGDDFVGGDDGYDQIFLGPGDDYADGGTGIDTVSYRYAESGVDVSLASARATGEGTDSLYGIESVDGTEHDDSIGGDGLTNTLRGFGGNDSLFGGEGADKLDGGLGDDAIDGGADLDVVSFTTSATGVHVDLAAASATGEGADSLGAMDNIVGSPYPDVLDGDDGANSIEAWGDTAHGFGGDDVIYGAASGDAGAGTDECWNSSIPNCERLGVIDFAASPAIFSPAPNADRSHVSVIRGGTKPGLSPPFGRGTRVVVALRRVDSKGCSFLIGHRLFERGCNRPLWDRAKGSTDSWHHRVDADLAPGTYTAFVWFKDPQAVVAKTGTEFVIEAVTP